MVIDIWRSNSKHHQPVSAFYHAYAAHVLLLIVCFFDRQYDIIPLLIDIAKSALKEKVIRVVIASFRVSW